MVYKYQIDIIDIGWRIDTQEPGIGILSIFPASPEYTLVLSFFVNSDTYILTSVYPLF